MALADLYVLDWKQVYNGEDTHNIFCYDSGGSATAVEVANAFIDDVVPLINDIQLVYMLNVSLTTKCLGNLSDNDFQVVAGGGTIAGTEMLPLHDAVNFTLKPTNRAVRPGSKRFPGIPEAVVTRGDILDAPYIAALELLRLGLDTAISNDDIEFYDPVIIKRVKYNPDPEDLEHFAYRFPEIGETPVTSTLAGVLFNTHVSHQVSRY